MYSICETSPSYGREYYPGSYYSPRSYGGAWGGGSCYPSVEIVKDNGYYKIVAEVPGISREDLEIDVGEGYLTLRGVKKRHLEGCECSERFFGSFERSFPLPKGIPFDKFEASLRDGLLTISFPAVGEAESKRIEIGSA